MHVYEKQWNEGIEMIKLEKVSKRMTVSQSQLIRDFTQDDGTGICVLNGPLWRFLEEPKAMSRSFLEDLRLKPTQKFQTQEEQTPFTLRQMPLEPWKYSLDLFWFSYIFSTLLIWVSFWWFYPADQHMPLISLRNNKRIDPLNFLLWDYCTARLKKN